jgi:hypothetical protein
MSISNINRQLLAPVSYPIHFVHAIQNTEMTENVLHFTLRTNAHSKQPIIENT